MRCGRVCRGITASSFSALSRFPHLLVFSPLVLSHTMAVQAYLPLVFDSNTSNPLQWVDHGLAYPLPTSQQQLMQQHSMASIPPPNASYSYLAPPLLMDPSQSLATFMEDQRQEIDQYLRLQNERLRAALAQRTNQYTGSLLTMLKSKALAGLRLKDEELAKAQKRAMELEELLRQAEAEKGFWQRAAQENEAMAMALSNALVQVQQPCCSTIAAAEEDSAASCTDFPRTVGGRGEADEPKATVEIDSYCHPCKSCGSRDSCMLLIPCRHLCLCNPCAALLDACPLCGSLKRDNLEVLMV